MIAIALASWFRLVPLAILASAGFGGWGHGLSDRFKFRYPPRAMFVVVFKAAIDLWIAYSTSRTPVVRIASTDRFFRIIEIFQVRFHSPILRVGFSVVKSKWRSLETYSLEYFNRRRILGVLSVVVSVPGQASLIPKVAKPTE